MPVPERKPDSEFRRQVGYFRHLELENKHLGAVLVTDQLGIPMEFKYTEPVTATRLHRVLYGASLERYLHETVIRDRLAGEVRSEPEVFIAPYEEREYLGAIAGRQMIAVQAAQAVSQDSGDPFIRLREREALVQLGDGPCLRLSFGTPDESHQHRIVAWLQETSRSMDILEPLDRIDRALRMLCGDEKKGGSAF